jgi:hypothetical protein
MRIALLVVIFVIGVCVVGCGGAEKIDAPEITGAVMGTTSVTVFWRAEPDIENHADFQGYNVYVSTDSSELLVEDGEELNKYNASVVTDTTFEIRNLSTQSLYYVQVRTLNTDDKVGTYNETVPFITASPRPEFTAVLKFDEYGPGVTDSCAIRFSDALVMSDSAMADSSADMWMHFSDTLGMPDISELFDSPSNHPEFGAQARMTYFANLGQLGFDDITEITTEPNHETVIFSVGDLIIAKTQDSHYVKIHVDSFVGGTDVAITYAYQDIADFPKLSP